MDPEQCGICLKRITSKTGGVQCIKCNKWSHFSCGKTKYSNDLRKTFVCIICKQKDSPKTFTLKKLRSKNNSPKQQSNNDKIQDQLKKNTIFPVENLSSKSPSIPAGALRIMDTIENITEERIDTIENITEERNDYSGSDLSCLLCDETTKDSPSFDCHLCLHRMHAACAAIDADIVLALQKPSGRFFLFTCEKCLN